MPSPSFPIFKFRPLSAAFMLALASTPVQAAPWYLEKINAPAAHAAGHTGAGVVVGIIDNGMDRDNPAFEGRVDARSRNLTKDDPLDLGKNLHGTMMAGLVGGRRGQERAYGVAYESHMLAMRVFDKEDDNRDDHAYLAALKHAARSRVAVLNGSFGPTAAPSPYVRNPEDPTGLYIPNPAYRRISFQPYVFDPRLATRQPDDIRLLRLAAAADVLMVFAAGNDYDDQPEARANPSGEALFPFIKPENHGKGVYTFIEPGANLQDPATYRFIKPSDPQLAHLDFSDLRGSIIAVVATDKEDRIASYSARCGVAWQWCIAAPGGDSNADGSWTAEGTLLAPATGNAHIFGTSASTAIVSGAAAVVRGAFPYLTARQAGELLLTTTNVTGHLADRAIYGRGLLDLGRAIQGPREFGAEGFDPIFDVDTQGYDSTWSGNIHGRGGMAKGGFGTLTMTGTNVYTGPTTITGGSLVVNGSNARSATIVEPFGRLSGTGTVGATHVAGTIEPGNAANKLGTLTVAGDYHQTATAFFNAAITPDERSNLLVVQGQARLDGGTLRIDGVSPVALGKQYTLIQAANGVTGDFAHKPDDYVYIDLVTEKTANAYTVKVARNSGGFGAVANTANQRAAGSGLDGLFAGNTLFDSLIMQTDAAAARSALGQLSGEIHPSVLGSLTNQSGMVREALIARLGQAGIADGAGMGFQSGANSRYGSGSGSGSGFSSGSSTPMSTGVGGKALWGQYLGSWNHVASDGNAAAINSSYNGMLFGADTGVGQATCLGMALGAGKSNVNAGSVNSSAKIDDYTLAAYGESKFDIAKVKYGTAYTWHSIDTRRSIAFANAGNAKADYDARTLQVFSELSTRKNFGRIDLEPYAGLAYVNTRADAFKESGVAGLNGDAASQDLTFSTLGLRARTTWELPKAGALNLEGGLGWRHAFGDVTPSTRMKFDGGSAFTIAGAPLARDAMLLQAGLTWNVSDRASVGIAYASQLGKGVNDQSAQARAVWRF